ncbi:Aste57867_15425 [Aphanomyces stellatus]|uniref:Aste57867_15425 protein n=1 Tax=Aphanomyces stellatus TaxID=120398 RepID=A0A485L336_9STRA|nr:hypothetical protein As57867_015369 [Aphanomyces stellatus]VFT92227.1 Aste57867_15425 [Aphanomyces stellatus]
MSNSSTLAAREAALVEQNNALNATSAKAQDEADLILRRGSRPVVGFNGAVGLMEAESMPSDTVALSEPKASLDSPKGGPLPTKRNQSISNIRSGSRADVLQQSPSKAGLRKEGSVAGLSALDARQRDQFATLTQLEEQIAYLVEANKTMERATEKMVDQMDQMKGEYAVLTRKLEQTQVQMEKQKGAQTTLESTFKASEGELAGVHTTLDDARRHEKHAAQSAKAVQIRLDRVTSEVEKVRQELKDVKEQKGGAAVPRVEFDRVLKEVQMLEKQKVLIMMAELMTVYKKQAKLIDILKRQKIHLEAAKDIPFTEDEFAKTLDWGS